MSVMYRLIQEFLNFISTFLSSKVLCGYNVKKNLMNITWLYMKQFHTFS